MLLTTDVPQPTVVHWIVLTRIAVCHVMCTLNNGNYVSEHNWNLGVEAQLAWRCLHSHLRPDLGFQAFLDMCVWYALCESYQMCAIADNSTVLRVAGTA